MHEITMRISEKIQDKNFIVVTKVGMPFLQEVQPSEGLVGNDRYEGFSKDLMDAIASRLKFKYTLVLVKDNSYGNIDKVTEKWNGMVREILDRVRFGNFTVLENPTFSIMMEFRKARRVLLDAQS